MVMPEGDINRGKGLQHMGRGNTNQYHFKERLGEEMLSGWSGFAR